MIYPICAFSSTYIVWNIKSLHNQVAIAMIKGLEQTSLKKLLQWY